MLDARAVQSRFLFWVTAITQEIVITANTAGSPVTTGNGARVTSQRRPTRPGAPRNAPAEVTPRTPSALIEEFSLRRRPETLVPPAVTGGGVAILPQ